MAIRINFSVVAFLAALLVAQTVTSQIIERPDILFIENPGTVPKIISPSDALLGTPRNNLVCTAALCSNVCWALGYRFGRCNANRVCVCSNF